MDTLAISKFISLAVIFLTALFFGLIPLKVRHLLKTAKLTEKWNLVALGSCLCFGAGVLLATVFLHIFPEASESFTLLMDEGYMRRIDYPLPELTLCSGFFLIYFLEELIYLGLRNGHTLGPEGTPHQSHARPFRLESTAVEAKRCDSFSCPGAESALGKRENIPSDPKRFDSFTFSGTEKANDKPVPGGIDMELFQQEIIVNPGNGDALLSMGVTRGGAHQMFHSLMIVLALSIHGFFEGLALGFETTTNGVWLFCLAICSHKTVMALSVGMELLEIGITSKLFFLHMIGFSIATPLGILISAAAYNTISEGNVSGRITIAVLQAISGGTILFVVFCEVLERERAKGNGRFIRFVAFILGFVVMACLEMINEPEGEDKLNSTSTWNFDHPLSSTTPSLMLPS